MVLAIVPDVSKEKEANRISLLVSVLYRPERERERMKAGWECGIFLQRWISAMKHKV